MAMSDAERKRLSRERQRQEKRERIKDAGMMDALGGHANYAKRSFAEFIVKRNSRPDLDANLDAFGVHILDSEFLESDQQQFDTQHYRDRPLTALERATGLVDVFIDAARELSELINAYKLEELDARIAEIETSDLSDPDMKKAALSDIVRLTDLRKRLDRDVRHTFREIRTKGEWNA